MDRRSFLTGALTTAVVPSVVMGAASIRPPLRTFLITHTTLEELEHVHEPVHEQGYDTITITINPAEGYDAYTVTFSNRS
jgi:hypothetical protein